MGLFCGRASTFVNLTLFGGTFERSLGFFFFFFFILAATWAAKAGGCGPSVVIDVDFRRTRDAAPRGLGGQHSPGRFAGVSPSPPTRRLHCSSSGTVHDEDAVHELLQPVFDQERDHENLVQARHPERAWRSRSDRIAGVPKAPRSHTPRRIVLERPAAQRRAVELPMADRGCRCPIRADERPERPPARLTARGR